MIEILWEKDSFNLDCLQLFKTFLTIDQVLFMLSLFISNNCFNTPFHLFLNIEVDAILYWIYICLLKPVSYLLWFFLDFFNFMGFFQFLW